jgi:hypothetical protein
VILSLRLIFCRRTNCKNAAALFPRLWGACVPGAHVAEAEFMLPGAAFIPSLIDDLPKDDALPSFRYDAFDFLPACGAGAGAGAGLVAA